TPPRDVVRDPITRVAEGPQRHPRIRLPATLYGAGRRNSVGVDLSDVDVVDSLKAFLARRADRIDVRPSRVVGEVGQVVEILNPADRRQHIGKARYATDADIDAAVAAAAAAQLEWDAAGARTRARLLVALSDRIEAERDEFVAMMVREAGKTIPDAISEV